MKAKIVYLALALALALSMVAVVVPASPVVAAGPWYVDGAQGTDDGTHGTGPGTDAFKTIQYAIDDGRVVSGDTINVAAETYAESLNIGKSLTISGAGAATTSVTGGIVIGGSFGGLTLEGMTLSGDSLLGSRNAVIDSSSTTGPLSDITIRDCVLDGGDVSGRAAFWGQYITGTWTFDGNEIMNFPSWYVIDNTSSSPDVPYKLGDVVFTNNDIHDVAGSIAFRGKISEEIDTAVVSGNTIDYSMITSLESECWATVEVNNVLDLEVFENTVTGVPEASWGGEGQAFQFWSVAPWTVDIHDNVITNNNQGIWINGHLAHGVGYDCYVPSGSVYDNDFVGNTAFGLWISDLPPGSDTSSAIGGPLNAENNWWGDDSGPLDTTVVPDSCGLTLDNPGVLGDEVSQCVDYDPWLTESTGGGGGCFIATAAYGTSTAEEIDTLRSFRDEVLLQNSLGSQLVEWYYQTSPPVADFISENSFLKTIVRELLVEPVVSLVEATEAIWEN